MKNIEMHCHTIRSDWLQTIDERLREASERGIDFLAITDHDVVIRESVVRWKQYNVQSCESVEISTINIQHDKSLHMTLYAKSVNRDIDVILNNTLASKVLLIQKQIEYLNQKWFSIDLEKFYTFACVWWRKKTALNKFDIARFIFSDFKQLVVVKQIEWDIDIITFFNSYFKTSGDKFGEFWIKIPDYEPTIEECKIFKEKSHGILALPHSNFTFKGGIEEFEQQLPHYIETGWINALEINCRATQEWVNVIIKAKNKYGLYITFWSDCHKTGNSDEKHGELWEKNPNLSWDFITKSFSEYKHLLI